MQEPNQPPSEGIRPGEFGDPGDLDDLLPFTDYDEAEIDSAVAWWDEHASDAWRGALED